MNKNKHPWPATIIAAVLIVALAPVLSLPTARGHHSFIAAETAYAPGGSPDAPQKYALLVGINEYGNPQQVSPLAGSINDVENMLQVLTTKFEFRPENIRVLKNAEATHANIIETLRNMVAKVKPGDIVVFHYSGHGSQMKDVTGKKISGLEETIVPYDSRDPKGKVFDIGGAELHGILLQLAQKTQNVTFILDSCHSGTLVRGARVRSIAADTRTPPPPPSYAVETTRGLGTTDNGAPLKYAFIAAATSKESAYEHYAEGAEHGALTYFLTQQLRSAKAGATLRDVFDGARGPLMALYPSQDPQLEGSQADMLVFGDSGSVARPYVLASPLDARHAKLSVGRVEGATSGSIYEVYAPGAKKFAPPEQPVARVQLTNVDAFESEGSIISGSKVATASRAVERSHRFGSSKLRVYLDKPDQSRVLQTISDQLQSLKYVEVVTNPAACHLQLREQQGRIQMLAADLSALSTPVTASDSAVIRLSMERIKLWAKYFNVLSIRNAHSGIDVQFTLKSSQTRDAMARVGRPDIGVLENESVDATVRNNSERDLYIAMLDLSSDGSIGVVFPTVAGAHEVLTPGSTMTRTLHTSIPKGRSRVTDILKVFASYKPIDLTPLTQAGIRGVPVEAGEPDPLEELLGQSTEGTRQVAAQPLNLGTWTTAQKTLVIRRKN